MDSPAVVERFDVVEQISLCFGPRAVEGCGRYAGSREVGRGG